MSQRKSKTAQRSSKRMKRQPSSIPPDSADLDLALLTSELANLIRSRTPMNYRVGRERMRSAIQSLIECEDLAADHLIDSMIARGYAQFTRHPLHAGDHTIGVWKLNPAA